MADTLGSFGKFLKEFKPEEVESPPSNLLAFDDDEVSVADEPCIAPPCPPIAVKRKRSDEELRNSLPSFDFTDYLKTHNVYAYNKITGLD